MRSAPASKRRTRGKVAEANRVSTEADIKSRAADLEHAKLEWDRGQELSKRA